jgi:copper homeostasis protein
MNKIIVEVCCGSADDVIQSKKAGADRVELNSNLFHGGLTPTVGELLTAKEYTGMEIMTMVRPREGGFQYTEAEFKTALADAKELLAHGSDGIVFGFLKRDGTIDAERCKAILDIIGDKQSVFHRAIDVVPEWKEAIDVLCELGITRILTSGQAPSVYDGINTVAEMIKYAGGRIQILPGAGIRPGNINEITQKTGCTQVHVASFKTCFDTSTHCNTDIFFGGAIYPPEDRFNMIDASRISEMCDKAKRP